MRGPQLHYVYRRWLFSLLSLFFFSSLHAQEININFSNEANQPLIGVQAFVENEGIGYISDENGNISFNRSDHQNAILVCQYLGYESIDIVIDEQLPNQVDMVMIEALNVLTELMIVGRANESITNTITQIEMIDAKEIERLGAQNAADVLQNSGDVYVQKSQYGGGSPVLRGFEANKLLLVVDGVRMNNAIYRNGHLQNAISVDHNSLQNVEILYGPGSLIYGSDALGGVIHFRTITPNFTRSSASQHQGKFYTSYNTVNNGLSAHLDFSIANRNLFSYTSISHNSFGDLKMGTYNRPEDYPDFGLRPNYVATNNSIDTILSNPNPELQVGSGYNQWDLQQKLGWKISPNLLGRINFQYSESSNIPRYDALLEKSNGMLRYAEWNYGPQKRLLISPTLEFNAQKGWFDKAILIMAYQKIDEDRITRNFESADRSFNEEDVNVTSATIDLNKSLGGSFFIQYGIDFQHNHVDSKALSKDIFTGTVANTILSRYPDGSSTLWNMGGYFKGNWYSTNENWNISAGIRQSFQQIKLNYIDTEIFQWPAFYYEGIESNSQSFVWNLQAKYSQDWYKLIGSIGTAFRAPNIDDLAKIRVKNTEITIPNPDLKPEQIINFEMGGQVTKGNHTVQTTVFSSILSDAIVRSSFTLPSGEMIYVLDTDSLLVTANINSDKARIFGFSIGWNTQWTTNWSSELKYNWTRGYTIEKHTTENTPLGHIPPAFGRGSISYMADVWEINLATLFNAKKRIENFGGSVDNPELSTPEGSLAWYIFSLDTKIHWRKSSFGLGVENIFDQFYRTFSSGISGPGRNFKFSFRTNF